MNPNGKYIAHLMFKVKVLSSDGLAFEDLFCSVMETDNPDFKRVKPQGQYGDRKNDGFDKTIGSYYQVYAPENLPSKVAKAVKKVLVDFQGLLDFWNGIRPIREYHFVMNDKYKGTFPEIELQLAALEKQHKDVKCRSFLCKNLEDIFLSLSEEQIIHIIGILPQPEDIADIEYGSLNEVINHLQGTNFQYNHETIPPSPDFQKKIIFNNLSDYVASLLENGNHQSRALKEYFDVNRKDLKSDLQKIFINLYVEGKGMITDNLVKSDEIFLYILEKATPKQTKPIQDCVLVLMSYFFEYCDIFETPQTI